MAQDEIFERLRQLIIGYDAENIKKEAERALAVGINPVDAIKLGLQKGMAVVGEKFKNFEITLPEVMLAADAMYAALNVLLPKLTSEEMGKLKRGKVVIGTVFGDIHDIGKNIVSAMLAANGYEIHDLGYDVDPKRFAEKAEEVKADMIAMSCLLSTSISGMEDLVKRLRDMDIRENYYVIVGGSAVVPEFVRQVGADGWGRGAEDAVNLCNILFERGKQVEKPVLVG